MSKDVKKTGQGPGGKFNGPSIKEIIKEKNLEMLENILPEEASPFITYMRSIRELHRMCITSDFENEDYILIILKFENDFNYLYDMFGLNMTLKIHIIIHHYARYFEETGTNFRDTNGEYTEAIHSSLKIHERNHNFTTKRKLGTPHHRERALQSHTSYNSVRAGGISPEELTLRSRGTSSPASSHIKGWKFKQTIVNLIV